MLKKFRPQFDEIFTFVSLSMTFDLNRMERCAEPDALPQSGFVYTSSAAAPTDMGMRVSGYVAGS